MPEPSSVEEWYHWLHDQFCPDHSDASCERVGQPIRHALQSVERQAKQTKYAADKTLMDKARQSQREEFDKELPELLVTVALNQREADAEKVPDACVYNIHGGLEPCRPDKHTSYCPRAIRQAILEKA